MLNGFFFQQGSHDFIQYFFFLFQKSFGCLPGFINETRHFFVDLFGGVLGIILFFFYLFSQKYQDQDAEIVILSTCNRVELYISSRDGAVKVEDVLSFLADFHKIELTNFSPYMYHYNDDRAVNHLFFVTASLDSMVLGE